MKYATFRHVVLPEDQVKRFIKLYGGMKEIGVDNEVITRMPSDEWNQIVKDLDLVLDRKTRKWGYRRNKRRVA